MYMITRLQEGTTQVITITPSDPQLTLALDNGVDITSQLQGGPVASTYTINNVSGASYGFSLNNNDYYESTNQGVSSSAAVARINLNLGAASVVTITYINYAEATYDYGMFGKVDTALGTGTSTDQNDVYLSCNPSSYNTSTPQTVTYNIAAGEHFIDVKYYKDQYTDDNNDSLQFKISSIEATGVSGDYTYTITNIQEKHSLIFVFGNVNYYFITSSGRNENLKLYPDGQVVVLEGRNYSFTVVPSSASTQIKVTDNNVDVTSSLEYESAVTDKGTVVNYTYKLTNVNAAHNLVVTIVNNNQKIYFKISGSWVEGKNVYIKESGAWIREDDFSVISSIRIPICITE